jgi:LPXTG-motif cell wall-anchored protein
MGVLLEKPAPVVAGRLTSLPRTGLDTGVLVSVGGILLLLGSALVGAAHRSKSVVVSG